MVFYDKLGCGSVWCDSMKRFLSLKMLNVIFIMEKGNLHVWEKRGLVCLVLIGRVLVLKAAYKM